MAEAGISQADAAATAKKQRLFKVRLEAADLLADLFIMGHAMQQNDIRNTGWMMPAEWVRHAATWMVWPHNQALWESGWGVTLPLVQEDFARVANAIAHFEPVKTVVDPSAVTRWAPASQNPHSQRHRLSGEGVFQSWRYRFSCLREGTTVWMDTMAIPVDARHPEYAYAFINFVMRPENMAAISNFTGYPTSNAKARPSVDPTMRNNPDIYPDDATYARLIPGKDIPQSDMRARMRTWTRFKTATAK